MIDLEDVLDNIKSVLQTNLNTKISQINSDKDDGITLDSIDDNAYYLQTLDGETINYNPYVFYGVQDIIGDNGYYSQVPQVTEIAVAVVIEDTGESVTPTRKLFRYQKALTEVITESFDSAKNQGVKMSVASQVPVELTLQNDSRRARAIGILIKIELG